MKSVRCDPQVAAHQGDGIDEGGRWLGVPGGSTLDDLATFLRPMGGQGNPDIGYYVYRTALHEAGHALGLSKVNFPLWSQPYSAAHPTITEAVVNYDYEMLGWVSSLYWETEPNCFPHQFDIMAVYALYQTSSPI